MSARKLFSKHYDEIRDAVEEDLEGWAELSSGPFNTDPIHEPRLDVLSENPEVLIEDSSTWNGIRSRFVVYVCDATILCNRYEDKGPDEPLTTNQFAAGVTYELPVSFEVDPKTGESCVVEVNGIAFRKWPTWPK